MKESPCIGFFCPELLWLFVFFFNDTATTEIYTLSLHDALPISCHVSRKKSRLPSLLYWVLTALCAWLLRRTADCPISFLLSSERRAGSELSVGMRRRRPLGNRPERSTCWNTRRFALSNREHR